MDVTDKLEKLIAKIRDTTAGVDDRGVALALIDVWVGDEKEIEETIDAALALDFSSY